MDNFGWTSHLSEEKKECIMAHPQRHLYLHGLSKAVIDRVVVGGAVPYVFRGSKSFAFYVYFYNLVPADFKH